MNENLHIIIIHIFFLVCALSGYIFVNPFTSCVPDRYQYKQCIIMETETETNMKNLHVFRFYWLCATCYIFVKPFISCVTDHYLPQKYITMQTIKVTGRR